MPITRDITPPEITDNKHLPIHKPNVPKRAQSPKLSKCRSPSPPCKQLASGKRCHSASPSLETAHRPTTKSPISPKNSVPVKMNISFTQKKSKSSVHQDDTENQCQSDRNIVVSSLLPQDVTIPQPVANKLMRQLSTKKRDFLKLKKCYFAQQNAVVTQYSELKQLMARLGTRDDIGDVRVLSVTEWPVHDLLMLILGDPAIDLNRPFETSIIHNIQGQLEPIPQEVRKLGDELMACRLAILNMVRGSKLRLDRATYVANIEWKAKNAELDAETEKLHMMIDEAIEDMKSRITSTLILAKTPWLDREALVQKMERLQKENLVLQHKLEQAPKYEERKPSPPIRKASSQAVYEDLKKERVSKEALKTMRNSAEIAARTARARITVLEKELKDAHTELDSVRRRNKDLENLYKNREATYESRSKRLLEVSRTGETTIDGLSRQRDALELRVKELQDEVAAMTQVNEGSFEKLRLQNQLMQVKEKENEFASLRIRYLEENLQDMDNRYAKIKECSAALVSYERSRVVELIPTKESEPSDPETELWKELQQTRIVLAKTMDELKATRADKEEFLASLARIAQEKNGESKIDKMASELVEREKTILNLRETIKKHEENEKNMQESISQYGDQLFELQYEIRKLRNYDCYVKEPENSELQAELMQLQMKVQALTRERSALISAATSRALMLERHERSADLFAKITLTRRQLADLLEGRDPEVLEYHGKPVSQSLSEMCADTSETWSALRLERARVQQLKETMTTATRHLAREGSVRMRLQQRRTKLERELMRTNVDGRYPLEPQDEPSRHTDVSASVHELRQHLTVFACL